MKNIDQKNNSTIEEKRYLSSIKKAIGTLILLIFLAAAGVVGKNAGLIFTKKYLPNESRSSKITELQRIVVGSTKLSILSPGSFNEKNFVMPDNFKAKVKTFKNYEYLDGYKMAITCSEIIYSSEIVANAKGAVNQIIYSLSNLNGVVNMNHSEKNVSVSGYDGIAFSATYLQNKAPIKAKGIVLTKGSSAWQVFIIYPSIIKEPDLLADRIIDSIEIRDL